MTTKIIVTVPTPNHHRARVTTLTRTDNHLWAPYGNPVEIDQGDSRDFHIHDKMSLEVDEIE